MLIPKYWAQHKQRFDSKTDDSHPKRQATIKRYGWSESSQAIALEHAKQRVDEAHSRWLAGEDIVRRERSEQYNASNSIPIREQIISEQIMLGSNSKSSTPNTQLIVTRNSYGSQVANVNNIAIIDVDNIDLLSHLYPDDYNNYDKFIGVTPKPYTALASNQQKFSMKPQVWAFVIISIIIASVIAWQSLSWVWLIILMLAGTALLWREASKKEQELKQANEQKQADHTAELLPFMTDLMQQRVISYPQERFRLYETPVGFRIIATHANVSPSDKIVAEWLAYFHADTNYVRLSQAQQCFRARLTPKPWRMTEVTEQHRLTRQIPAKNLWFINDNANNASLDEKLDEMDEEQYDAFEQQQAELAARQQWIIDYDNFAKGYRACRYIESFAGRDLADKQNVQTVIDEFVEWHDKACQVDKELPMA